MKNSYLGLNLAIAVFLLCYFSAQLFTPAPIPAALPTIKEEVEETEEEQLDRLLKRQQIKDAKILKDYQQKGGAKKDEPRFTKP